MPGGPGVFPVPRRFHRAGNRLPEPFPGGAEQEPCSGPVPALVVGIKIPGGNPAFRQDKSEISLPGMAQACCIKEGDRRVLPVPLGGIGAPRRAGIISLPAPLPAGRGPAVPGGPGGGGGGGAGADPAPAGSPCHGEDGGVRVQGTGACGDPPLLILERIPQCQGLVGQHKAPRGRSLAPALLGCSQQHPRERGGGFGRDGGCPNRAG